MNLTLPAEDFEEEDVLFEDEDALDYVAEQLTGVEEELERETHARSVIQTRESDHEMDPDLVAYTQSLIEGLHRDFDGTVMRNDVPPENLIPRGPHGEGVIKIRPGYQARKQRAIHLTGERLTALTELVQKWKKEGKVEEGQGE